MNELNYVTVLWANDCGETLCEETLPAEEVWDIVVLDERGEWNRYILPDGTLVDAAEFLEWYRLVPAYA